MSILDRERTIAPPGYNRWLVPPAALAVHLSIGQVYAYSVLKDALRDRFDASHTQIGVIFSISIVMLGLSAAFGGRWMERNGPRKTMVISAAAWVSGFAIAGLGVSIGQLWVVYLGYGVIGGIGLGLGYISPVSTLIKWFPDRPGLATGLAIMGFGGGALLAAPLTQFLLKTYGDTEADALVPTFLTLGGLYASLMLMGAAVVRVPPKGYKPDGWEPTEHVAKVSSGGQVSAKNAIKTFPFWMLWLVLFTNVTAGIGILENAKPMIEDYFPAVTAAAAAGFVGLLSLANMGGRIGWSSFSDVIGRKAMYVIYLGVGALAYTGVALFGPVNVALFVALVVLIISFYGGGFATIPAYLKDVFGEFEVGAIHGRLLTAWSAAGVAGPLIINGLLDILEGQGLEGADLYRPSMLVMVGVLAIGFIANLLVRPVHARWHEAADAVPDHERHHAAEIEEPALAGAGKEG
ncbi:L-lactate MFS transporter [Demequina lignilytica]|uniref:OFA family MFS transporter n=1 Tax=Demequina lignilytica TaxID=3051663 RepID=A0AAW7M9X7_9MICO|nr:MULTISPECIES: OFA family MFS transporter [unclassified Demequina]MDN4478911.1 OFA family MFS transporter [Demequina sp. SYSU T00039-1]MDN4483042.1 OFA family MFS transporter [Demequina sp. SYSU T0a273]MDN4488786.1 OFA family MFS transporter [Demequina sp. SYSU T00039]MDN4491830.1 OFA family MFS transporter [Demequina sp. SYSU T00068]